MFLTCSKSCVKKNNILVFFSQTRWQCKLSNIMNTYSYNFFCGSNFQTRYDIYYFIQKYCVWKIVDYSKIFDNLFIWSLKKCSTLSERTENLDRERNEQLLDWIATWRCYNKAMVFLTMYIIISLYQHSQIFMRGMTWHCTTLFCYVYYLLPTTTLI